MQPVISVENLSKQYRIGHIEVSAEYRTLRDSLASLPKRLFRRSAGVSKEVFWALRDVNFTVMAGERIGLIGRNGAGKSTLLKLLSRITEPSTGRITMRGRVASLLEVGTGFHPELTGRENIYLNGTILGMTRKEITAKFDEIVDFSGVEKFLDTPIKRYSSGMYVRLGFAVAAHLEPEILVVDEVLAVGDADFQKKCMGKMESMSKGEGRTILFVSHNMAAISKLCSRSLLLEGGRLTEMGDTSAVIASYLSRNLPEGEMWSRDLHDVDRYGSQEVICIRAAMRAYAPDGESRVSTIHYGDDLELELEAVAAQNVLKLNVAFVIYSMDGTRVIDANLAMTGDETSMKAGESRGFVCRLRNMLLNPGRYTISLWLGTTNRDYDGAPEVLTFQIVEPEHNAFTTIYPGLYRCAFSIRELQR